MGLFSKKKESVPPKPIVCACCGGKTGATIDLDISPDQIERSRQWIQYLGSEAGPPTRQFNQWGIELSPDKRLCGWCFSYIMCDMTNEVIGPEDFPGWEDYKIEHIYKTLLDMPIEEMQERRGKILEGIEERKAELAAEKEKEKEEWLKTLR